ncbi:hypothetical protein COLO4_35858 [Corchorus olitorius]|uniref:Uncharacterized protein n=1 Tax=Corchorus olitorius TaxID=93759 RepID=A0A1R3GCN4_9ROSI|nr:hypothetical protein COLO4_35858 [Corchorus olitorius]
MGLGKKKTTTKSGTESYGELCAEINNYTEVYREKNESIKTTTKYFDREFEDKDLKKELVKELMKFPWLNKSDIYKVAQHIIKDATKFELYSALPNDMKEYFVKEQLNECNPYVSSFDFGGGD